MKTYKAKSSVKRAIVKQFGTKVFEEGTVVQNKDETWSFIPKIDKVKEEPKKTKKAKKKTKRVYENSSSAPSPCSLVWSIAEEMGTEAKRKDVLARCVEEGVAFYTARTQYQKYKEALRGDIK